MLTFIQHIDIEGPSFLQSFCQERNIPFRVVDVSSGAPFPDDWEEMSGLVVLGGPMNVYEEDRYPFLSAENRFIQDALSRDVPYLGICLGSQLLAKAAGARVSPAAVPERGFFRVSLTPQGETDCLFRGTGPELDVFQWHDDTFAIPDGGTLLSTSAACPHQAFRVGKHAYGLQFHFEISEADIRAWSARYLARSRSNDNETEKMLSDFREKAGTFFRMAEQLAENFVRLTSVRPPAPKQ